METHPSELRRRSSVIGSFELPRFPLDVCPSDDEPNEKELKICSEDRAHASSSSGPFLGMLVTAILIVLWQGGPSGGALWSETNLLFLPYARTSSEYSSSNHVSFRATEVRSSIQDPITSSALASKASPEVASSCQHLSPASFVAIRGERHSATNLFREITNRNGYFQQSCRSHNERERCEGYLGWKHGFLKKERDFIDVDRVIVAVMVRDVFSWLVSMFYEPYNMVFDSGTDEFGVFLRSNYTSATCEEIEYDKNCSFPMEEASNLMKLRTKKYRNWIGFLNPSLENDADSTPHGYRHSIIRQEELQGQTKQEKTMQSFFNEHCVEYSPKFKYIGKIVTNSMQSNHAPREAILSKFATDELQYVLDNLDLDFEKQVLGYDYTYVKDYIAQRTNGNAPYAGPPELQPNVLQKRLDLIEANLGGKLPGRDMSMEEAAKLAYAEKQKRGLLTYTKS